MDFFAHQEAARRRTGWLVVMFFAALAGIIATTYVACAIIFQVAFTDPDAIQSSVNANQLMWSPEMLLGITSAISLLVFGGTAFKLSQLKQGGEVVAKMLGGHPLNPATTQFHERRLLNVVEEMALASGVPVPPVYVMPGQAGINAFAAGYSIHDAVVGVTEGTMRGLKREELQGVVAHEFSHILNGDMRLNIRLMGILHGLLLLAMVGRLLLRFSGRSSSGKKGGAAIVVALGLALLIIGYAGYFFGGLIKRAVSRQREYLADASAVQFTRDTSGLAGALKKIGGLARGGAVNHPKAEELSHMFFCDGIKRFFGSGSLFSTHPPLVKRVKLLEPNFDGEFPIMTEDSLYVSGMDAETTDVKSDKKTAARDDFIKRNIMMGEAMAGGSPQAMMQQIGILDVDQHQSGTDIRASIPTDLREAVHDPVGSQSVVLAVLLAASSDVDSSDAWTWIPASFIDSVGRYMEMISTVTDETKLLLVEMSMPALKMLTKEQAERFIGIMQQMIDSDKNYDLYEFAVMETVRSGLRQILGLKLPSVHVTDAGEVKDTISLLLSLMARTGAGNESESTAAFEKAAGSFGKQSTLLVYQSAPSFSVDTLRKALDQMLTTAMPVRKKMLEACLVSLTSDQRIGKEEIELFRAFAAAMEIPVPPLHGQLG